VKQETFLDWKFDQAPNVACITCRAIIDGAPVLIVTHYEDDDSWAFLDGQPFDPEGALVVSMAQVVSAQPDLEDIADLAPGWTATRAGKGQPWVREEDNWADD
jgi:diadenosine tetraphosphate (Ap4A) HIT family hydrolase